MSEWTDMLAARLSVTSLDEGEEQALLDAAREIAHRRERKDTPLSAYLVGVASGVKIAAGTAPSEAFTEAMAALATLLPTEGP